MHPKYKLDPNNIALVCSIDCHYKLDSTTAKDTMAIVDHLDR